MRGDRARLAQAGRLTVPAVPAVQFRHPLAQSLRHAWVPQWTAGQNRLRNLVRNNGELPVADLDAPAPTWTTGVSGVALSFDGTTSQLVHASDPSLLWNPFDAGVAYTFAYVGRMKSFGTSGRVLYSHNSTTAGTASLELAVRDSRFEIFGTQDALSGESVGCSLFSLPGIGNLFAVVGVIRSQTTSALAMRDYQGGTRASATDSAGNIASLFFNTMDQESFGSWHGGGSVDPNAYADTDMLGAFGWNRALSDAEMQAFLDDPFGMVRPRPVPSYQGPGATALAATLTTDWSIQTGTWTFADSWVDFANPLYLFDGTGPAAIGAIAVGSATLTSQWTFLGGQASASSTAAGATVTSTWSMLARTQIGAFILPTTWSFTAGTATGIATTTGTTLTSQWFLLPGTAAGVGGAAGATLTATWSLTAGTATSSNAAPGATLASLWTMTLAGVASSSTPETPLPIPFIGGGGMGPGGDPATAARIRASAERAADKAFDPVGWSKRESEEAARKMREALQAETDRTRPERMVRSTLRYLALTEDD